MTEFIWEIGDTKPHHHSPCRSIQCARCYPNLADGYNAARACKTGAGATPGTPDREAEAADTSALGNDDGEILGGTPRYPSSSPLGPAPTFSPVDEQTGSLLDLLAEQHPAIPEEEREWDHFVGVLQQVAGEHDGLIDQNFTRPKLRGEIKPSRVGAYFHRAAREGLIRAAGWTVSDDLESKNRGKPTRSYDWLGT